ncbi:recombinase [Mesorhizobium sp. M1A.F.Ca.IN.020.04.1.1]|nr:recombination protein NinB [Mesorhizobium sp. M1A.F.Ca.IN.020.04.1.1]RUW04018.1 recombinase [Mesorhizobium sp. M1A.F.Ca.IN.020.04.1.1]RUW04081.1 recombinase [Mesorhizobium sp. M1A.F.Ca.IN.020.04.1.1]TIO90321.1 MAG: recombinase [Mesorhizobium sp.]
MAQTCILRGSSQRALAKQLIDRAPVNAIITIREMTRNVDQNAKFHAICSDLARSSFAWAGKRRNAEEWKVLLVSGHTVATKGQVEIVPGLEGEFVNVRESTSRMNVSRASSLIEYAVAFCASHNVALSDDSHQEEKAA